MSAARLVCVLAAAASAAATAPRKSRICARARTWHWRSRRAATSSSSISSASSGACRSRAGRRKRSRGPPTTRAIRATTRTARASCISGSTAVSGISGCSTSGAGMQTALTATPSDEREPDFMPDGRSVVFVSEQTGHACLWSVALERRANAIDGGTRRSIVPHCFRAGQVAYVCSSSPDSRRSEFCRARAWARLSTTSAYSLSAPSWRPGGDVFCSASAKPLVWTGSRMLLLASPGSSRR